MAPSSQGLEPPGKTGRFNIVLGGRTLTIKSSLATAGAEAKTLLAAERSATRVLKVYHRQDPALEGTLKKISISDHPNIVRILGVGSESGKTWEIMEYKAGGTLADLIRSSGPIQSEDTIRRLLTAVLAGLRHLHDDLRVVYQDLKPDNILLPEGDVSKAILTDFGISSLMSGDSDSIDVVANGTRDYAAPELSRFGATHTVAVSSKVDYFALGVTILEMWLGASPYHGISDGKRRDLILSRSTPMPQGMPAGLRELVLGLLEPAASSRFGARAVSAWIHGKPLQAPPAVRRYPDARFDDTTGYNSPKLLAEMMLANLGRAEQLLFEGGIVAWLKEAGDFELVGSMQKIIEQCRGTGDARRAGVYRAVYRLNPQLPFTTAGNRICRGLAELGAALREERSHYSSALLTWRDPVYAYLDGQMASDLANETLNRYQEGPSKAEYALSNLIYSLERGDSPRVRLGAKMVEDPDEIGHDQSLREAFAAELRQDHSPSLMWLRDCGAVRTTKALRSAPDEDLLGVLMLFPWLKLDNAADGLTQERKNHLFREAVIRGVSVVVRLIDAGVALKDVQSDAVPLSHLVASIAKGNASAEIQDTLDFLIGQGVELNVKNGMSHTPLIEAVRNGSLALVKKLLSHGAKIDFPAGDGLTPLASAVESLNDFSSPSNANAKIVEALLDAGADPFIQFPQRMAANGWIFRGTIIAYAVRRQDENLLRILKRSRRYSESRALACGHPVMEAATLGWKEGMEILYPSAAFRASIALRTTAGTLMKAVAWFLFALFILPTYVMIKAPSGITPGPLTTPFMDWNIWTLQNDVPLHWGLLMIWLLYLAISYIGLWMKSLMKSGNAKGAFRESMEFVKRNKLVFVFILPAMSWFIPAFAGTIVFYSLVLILNQFEGTDFSWIATVDVFSIWVYCGAILVILVAGIGLMMAKTWPIAGKLKDIERQVSKAKARKLSSIVQWLVVLGGVGMLSWFYLSLL